jgi:excisionase family DNA binding protein
MRCIEANMPTAPTNVDEIDITPTIRSLIADEVKAAIKSPEMRELIAQEISRALGPWQQEKYLTAKDAADLMRCNPQTVLRLVHAGRLKSAGEGRLLRILQSSLKHFMAERGPPRHDLTGGKISVDA